MAWNEPGNDNQHPPKKDPWSGVIKKKAHPI